MGHWSFYRQLLDFSGSLLMSLLVAAIRLLILSLVQSDVFVVESLR